MSEGKPMRILHMSSSSPGSKSTGTTLAMCIRRSWIGMATGCKRFRASNVGNRIYWYKNIGTSKAHVRTTTASDLRRLRRNAPKPP